MNRNRKILFVIVSIVSLALLAGYHAWINRWKTYKNTDYGFEFKYPKDFFSSDDERIFPLIVMVQNPETPIDYNFGDVYLRTFGIIDFSADKTDKQIDDKIKLFEYFHLKKTTIDGRLAYYDNSTATREGGKKITVTRYWIFNNDNVFAISFRKDDIGEKIFSTFRFIE